MELFTTVILITLSITFSVNLITKGINVSKKIVNGLKNGQN
jgi:hypothetical protein